MARGAEAYLQMWERAVGIKPDSCRNPGLRKSVAAVAATGRARHDAPLAVMRAVGQPFSRLGTTYGVCAKTPSDNNVRVTIRLRPATAR